MATYGALMISICATIGVFVLFGAVALWGRRKARKERERRSRNEGGHTPSEGGTDAAPAIARGRPSLQSQRRADPDAPKYIGGPAHRLAPTWVGLETGEWGSNIATMASPIYPEPQRPSAMIPDSPSMYRQSQCWRQGLAAFDDNPRVPTPRLDCASVAAGASIYPELGHQDDRAVDDISGFYISSFDSAVIPWNGASPPAYSDLSRTRSGQTSRGSSR